MAIDPVTIALGIRLLTAAGRTIQAAIEGKKAPDPQKIAALIARGDTVDKDFDDLFADQTTPP